MLKDSRGYLWLGTVNGLKRYDANFTVNFKKGKHNKYSLVHNKIESLCEDRQGRIWVGTTEGVCFFDRKANRFTRFEELNKPDFACRNIICDSRGDIWFSIRDAGLYRFDTRTNRLTNFRHEENNPKSLSFNRVTVKGLIEDISKKGLWVSCSDKLNYFDFATQTFFHSDNNPLNIPILTPTNKSALVYDRHFLVYADNATHEICWYDTRLSKIVNSFKTFDKKNKPLADFYQIFFDSNHDLWVSGIDNRMLFIDSKLRKTIWVESEEGNKNSFTGNLFLDALQEENGTIWFSTFSGIAIIKGSAAKNPANRLSEAFDFTKAIFDKDPSEGIMNFAEDEEDHTWWFLTTQNRFLIIIL